MPELPEVETIRQDLRQFILQKKITKLEVFLPRLIKSDLGLFKKILQSNSFQEIKRTGKLLIFALTNDPDSFLLIHLRMTGQLVYCTKDSVLAGGHSTKELIDCQKNKHSYVIFHFSDDSKLFFNDQRTFGALKIVNSAQLQIELKRFGIEPLQKNFTLGALKKIIANHETSIKSLLLNQQLISGIGNIYADEILFRAAIRPQRTARSLTALEIKNIHGAANIILRDAIKSRGTTFNNYVDGRGQPGSFVKKLKVYGRGKLNCFQCKNVLQKIKVAGRGTVFCEQCQK